MISNKTLKRDSKPEDWASSVNFLTILCYEFTYLSKIKGFCKHGVRMMKFQPNPPRKTCPLALGRLLVSLPFSQAGRLLNCLRNSPGRVETSFIFHSNKVLLWGGGKRSEEGKGFFCFVFFFLWGLRGFVLF